MAISHLERRAGELTLIVDDKPYVMLAGEVHNSTSSSPAWMEAAWQRAEELGLNTVLSPVTWELLEPHEGAFDFGQVDMLIEGARAHGMRLVPLWFGSWKNGQCYYTPRWVKAGGSRFWRAEATAGVRQTVTPTPLSDMVYSTLSAFCKKTRDADARAFAALMAHIRAVDAEEGTVIAVQVENECGLSGAARDHCAAADEAYQGEVPEELLAYLRAHVDELAPDVREAFEAGTGSGSWEDVFGAGDIAEEQFQAWHTARFVETVAAAGKAEYPLPLLVNAWLDKGRAPGTYPTGGPVPRVHEAWAVAAPSIDVRCPDIYVRTFCDVCDSFRKLGNPLAIPETVTHAYTAPRAIWSVGHHHALLYAPFGFEEMGLSFNAMQGFLFGIDVEDPALSTPQDPGQYAAAMHALSELVRVSGELTGDLSGMDAVVSEQGAVQELDLGAYRLTVRFEDKVPGACLALATAKDECLVLGTNCVLVARSNDEERPHLDFLEVEDGSFVNGAWVRDRRLNGDEVAYLALEGPTILRMHVLAFA